MTEPEQHFESCESCRPGRCEGVCQWGEADAQPGSFIARLIETAFGAERNRYLDVSNPSVILELADACERLGIPDDMHEDVIETTIGRIAFSYGWVASAIRRSREREALK